MSTGVERGVERLRLLRAKAVAYKGAPFMHHAPEIPAYLTSRFTLQVRFCETDLMGIVHHANYLAYFEAGRVDWLHRRGLSYDFWVKQGIHLPVVETRLRYRKAARFDDVLVVETWVAEVTRAKVQFDAAIRRGLETLVSGSVWLACVAMPEGRIVSIPASVRAATGT